MKQLMLCSAALCLCLAACSSPSETSESVAPTSPIVDTAPEVEPIELENVRQKTATIKPKSNISESKPASLCRDGYCPCENSVSSFDDVVCDALRDGRLVSDEWMSIAASARGVTTEIDEARNNMRNAGESVPNHQSDDQNAAEDQTPTEMSNAAASE